MIPIEFTLSGIFIVSIDMHPLNALDSISSIPSFQTISFNKLAFSKADCPIFFNALGNSIFVI